MTNTKKIEDAVRAMSMDQREWLISLELSNQARLKGPARQRAYQAEQFRKRAIRHIQRGGGKRIR